MLPGMKRRSGLSRFFVLLVAALQLASTGFSALAHGKLARQGASGPATHVEGTTSSRCPVVHAPDCAVCRYLTTVAQGSTGPELVSIDAADTVCPTTVARSVRADPHGLPPGRAPPSV
jgi:hypothetical protein